MSIFSSHRIRLSLPFLFFTLFFTNEIGHFVRITGNWSASSSSARQSLESDFNKSPKKGSQTSLDKDSACSLNLTSSNASDQPSEDRFVLISSFFKTFTILRTKCQCTQISMLYYSYLMYRNDAHSVRTLFWAVSDLNAQFFSLSI